MKNRIIKRTLTALLAIMLMLSATGAMAAEWAEGTGPDQPYANVPKVNLNETMGYIILYPRAKLPTHEFCNMLEIYLPREDVVLSDGTLTVYQIPTVAEGEATPDPVEVETIAFDNEDQVRIMPLTETQLANLVWGSGVDIEIKLTKSLELNGNYYVLMDENCFTAADGTVTSIAITNPEAWQPTILGDYGVSNMYYATIPVDETDIDETDDEAVVDESGEEEEAETEDVEIERVFTLNPTVGDVVTFDIVLGGDAKTAVLYSENDSVYFEEFEFSESTSVTAAITKEDVKWGIVFINEFGDYLNSLAF